MAVCWIYDGDNGNYTAYGNLWRDRVEAALAGNGYRYVPRKDIVLLIDEAESFGRGKQAEHIWREAGAEVMITGAYYFQAGEGEEPDHMEIVLKAVWIGDAHSAGAVRLEGIGINLSDRRRMVDIKGNAIYKRFEQVEGGGNGGGPPLEVKLDRKCYPSGGKATITIHTTPAAYVYIFNIAADGSVTRIVPNRVVSAGPVPATGRFVFPPPTGKGHVRLRLFAMDRKRLNLESFKVVASRHELDFSFIPFPENALFYGIEAGELKNIVEVIEDGNNVSVKDVDYWVGPGC